MTSKAQNTKEKKSTLDFIKTGNLCYAKDTIKRLKRQAMGWKKRICTSLMLARICISKIYREFSMLSLKSPIRKWERRLEQTFTEQGIQMANKPIERC